MTLSSSVTPFFSIMKANIPAVHEIISICSKQVMITSPSPYIS